MSTLRLPVRREVPKDWEERLAAITPPHTARLSWLKLIWEEGYPWEPVERYMIYQMIPARAVDEAVLEQLRDFPAPSKMGNYYDAHFDNGDGKPRGKFMNNPDCLITERAWHLYRETQCWGRPFWVIQGPNGGHKRWFSEVERKFLKLAGLPIHPPPPGDLPYAEFSDRTIDMIMKHDLMLQEHSTLRRRRDLLGGLYDARQEEQEQDFRNKLVNWLADQVTEAGEGVSQALMDLDAPRRDIDVKQMEAQSEIAEENFRRTGKTHGGLYLVEK